MGLSVVAVDRAPIASRITRKEPAVREKGHPRGRGWPSMARARGVAAKPGSAEADDVLGRGALGALHGVELDALALAERAEAAALDGAVMDEQVLAAVLGRDEPEALGVVEPLHGTGGTHTVHSTCFDDRLPWCGVSVLTDRLFSGGGCAPHRGRKTEKGSDTWCPDPFG